VPTPAGARRPPRGKDKKLAITSRALADLDAWLGVTRQAAE
jgi:hypothetical protein